MKVAAANLTSTGSQMQTARATFKTALQSYVEAAFLQAVFELMGACVAAFAGDESALASVVGTIKTLTSSSFVQVWKAISTVVKTVQSLKALVKKMLHSRLDACAPTAPHPRIRAAECAVSSAFERMCRCKCSRPRRCRPVSRPSRLT